MEISLSNVIVNYFLLHTDVNFLPYDKLQLIIKHLENKFHVTIVDNDINGMVLIQQICSDFLSIDKDCNLIQNNILDYLDQLQPIYEWVSFRQWEKSQQYYNELKKF